MNFGPVKGSPLYIFDNFLADFSLTILAIAYAVIRGNIDALLENTVLLVIAVIGPLGRIISYLCTTYEVKGDHLIVRKGFISKSVQEVPLSSITSVDVSAKVFYRIFGAKKLTVDNGSNLSSTESKISMIFNGKRADELQKILVSHKKAETGTENVETAAQAASVARESYTVRHISPASELLLMGFLKSKGSMFWKLVAAVFALYGAASTYLSWIVNTENLTEQAAGFFLGLGIGLGRTVLVLAVIFFILSAAAGAVGSFIRYYNFTIREDEKNIRISYGLLNKKDYVLPKEKISGFNFEQSLFMRFAGKGCLYVYAVGYGEGGASTEEPLLMPLVKREDAYKEVSSFLGCDIGSYEPVRPAKNAAPLFFLTFGSAFFISVTAAAFVVSGMDMAAWLEDVWIFAIFLLMYLAGRWLCYLHTAISASDEAIYISSGGYKVKSVFLKMKNVENCESSSSGLKRRLKALNVKIRLFASSSSAVHDIKNVPERVFGMINEKMIF